jgi:hypothetical protein
VENAKAIVRRKRMEVIMGDAPKKTVIRFLIWLMAGIFVVVCLAVLLAVVLGEKKEDKYAILLSIENNIDHPIFAVALPVVTNEGMAVDRFSTSHNWRTISPTSEPKEKTTVPIIMPAMKTLGKIDTEQIRLEAHHACYVSYYLGKNVRFEDLHIVVIAWVADTKWNSSLLQMVPHGVYTLHNPKYVIGPENYKEFGHVIVE